MAEDAAEIGLSKDVLQKSPSSRAVHFPDHGHAGVYGSRGGHWRDPGFGVWCLIALSGLESRADGERVDSGRGHFAGDVPKLVKTWRTRFHDLGEQHHPNRGFGG